MLFRSDYVIVGAGSAGCVLANRLSADPKVRVLLLEAGGRDNYIWIHIPIGYLYTQNNPRTDWCFRTESEAGLNGRALNYPRGRVLGGCSAINGMIYMRGQARDYDLWRQMGNPGWAWDDVLPYFRKSEDFVHGADEAHGAGGEWRVEEMRLRWEILDAFREAAAETGIPKITDFNRGDNEGCGYFQVNQKKGVRWTTAKGFLRPAIKRPNLMVLTHAQAKALRLDGKRVTGIDFWLRGIENSAEAGEVILAAGSIGSPQILQLSGIGDGPERKPFLRPGFDTARPVSRPLLRAVPEAMLRIPQNASWERHTVRTGRAGRPRILVAGGVGGISGNTPLTQRCTPVYSCGLPQKAALERAF